MKPSELESPAERRFIDCLPGSHAEDSRRIDARRSLAILVAAAGSATIAALAGCTPSANQDTTGGSSGNVPGTVVDQPPDPTHTIGSLHFVVDANDGGGSNSPHMIGMKWGRLAQVVDSTGTLHQVEMVIGPDIPSVDPNTYSLTTNPVTDQAIVKINFAYGTTEYLDAFLRLDQNLVPIVDKSLSPDELPPYSMAPRNSALVILFDDLLDMSTVQASTVKLLVGNPPTIPMDVRIIPDVNHGDTADLSHYDPITQRQVPGGDGNPEFHTTRVILDTTVSELESAGTNPPLPQNALGLPPSPTPNLPNIALRIPTVQDASVGQLAIVRNASGHAISFTGSGPTDPESLTRDVVRALRSGNNQDQNHGFLFDDIPPQVVGTQPVGMGTITGTAGDYQTSVTFTTLACARSLKIGDVLQQPGIFGQVTRASGFPDPNGRIDDVHFTILFPPDGTMNPGPAQVSSVFDGVANFGQQACFLRFTNIAQPPSQRVALESSVILRFSEPMDPLTVKPFDSFTMTRVATAPAYNQYVPAQVVPSADLRQFTFTPVLPLRHMAVGTADPYWVNVANDDNGPTDLAGNLVLETGLLPQVPFTTDPAASVQNTNGFAIRFSSTIEANVGNPNAGPDFAGQFLYDLDAGQLKPRSVTRFAAAATREKPVMAAQTNLGFGVVTPLSPLGSKCHSIWRYCDVGLGLLDEGSFNVDVEGLDWAPVGEGVISDLFHQFAIYLSHSVKLPDESIGITTLLPIYPQSGLVATYSQNVLADPPSAPQTLVHNKNLGYLVDPASRFLSATNPPVTMMPYPLNRSLPPSQRTYYTWRDTSLTAVGSTQNPSSPGAELLIVKTVTGIGQQSQPYPPGNVPTVGLPLLMEFRCYPDDAAHGLNSLDLNIAINSSSLPNFRAFSTGGTNSSGTPIRKDPDGEQVANGGFNPSSNPPGAPTLPVDNVVYIGQMDLIVRISRGRSIFFDTGAGATTFSEPVIEPRAVDQPAGTQVRLAFRGATVATGDATLNASGMDVYGNFRPPATGAGDFTPLGDTSWKSTLASVNGARYFQVRLTFISNTETQLTPSLSALGFAYRK